MDFVLLKYDSPSCATIFDREHLEVLSNVGLWPECTVLCAVMLWKTVSWDINQL